MTQTLFSTTPCARPIRAGISADALRHNYALARRQTGGARAWAVIKADAYGHGQWRAVEALRGVADGFALLEAENGAALRAQGITQPILLLEGVFSAADLRLAAEHRLDMVIHCREQLDRVLADWPAGVPLRACLKVNTGMNRLGFDAAGLAEARQKLAALPGCELTLMTHFADADGAGGVAGQIATLNAMAPDWQGPVSLANSAALLRYPETHRDWVRPGIMLYGASPFAGESAAGLGLRPVMRLDSAIIAVQSLAAGDRVGYGGTFTAPQAMRIGIVAGGYADGYPRHAPTGTPVAVGGQRTRTLGRVSMDMLAVDLSAIPDATTGTPVTLWGDGAGGHVPADEVAAAAGTIAYELFCGLAPRVPVLED